MISTYEAEKAIASALYTFKSQLTQIEEMGSHVLREDIFADRSYPPFNRVAMDGIAIAFDQFRAGRRSFIVEGCQKAGSPQLKLQNQANCLEAMTGASLPESCDTVIPYEQIEIRQGVAYLGAAINVVQGQNIHGKGSDYSTGDRLLSKGRWLRSPEWSILASVGKASVKTSSSPRIAVVSTGDELVPVDQVPEAHQIRMSNSWAIKAALNIHDFDRVEIYHIPDDERGLESRLGDLLLKVDCLILTGGVSRGKFDFVPQVLERLQVDKIFHRIKQKPGKPMWFGTNPEGKLVFGLPGNPVSTLVCLHRYVIPALQEGLGLDSSGKQAFAILAEDVVFKKDLTYFLPVRLRWSRDGIIVAHPIQNNGSGDFAALSASDGFLELPQENEYHKKGEVFPLYLWQGGLA
ncbi:molybdopterin molybdotransferase MoeA [Pseudobacteriovorax antillogorgiicola]|uniref:Molybdopterin molybdenumtransferase n=1 Tax=Pseudobacteriovorax antillogorgiicola TaxID=1513793 RepID=A0A1Y6C9J1_9BACT|nr:molybdopterin molybdotransferase MoeA [Pseudobacteriovorax antillogorgiicola]TCS49016.1 molybdopterin molybdochelatase [Pseudobacteriovorax antillogorgiicola]SMF53013.1 molybdopterin molybdochelatase [Pseudobacteriovorax antillogorgiicola]